MADGKAPSQRVSRLLEIADYLRRIEEHKRNERNGVTAVWNPPLTVDEVLNLSRMEHKLLADLEEIRNGVSDSPLTPEEKECLREHGRQIGDLGPPVTAPIQEPAPPPAEAGEVDSLRAELDRERQRSATLAAEVERLRRELQEARKVEAGPQVQGATYSKLIDVLAGFPAAYPDPSRAKLDADIRQWIQKTTGCNEREKHVFGTILAEHFGLKD